MQQITTASNFRKNIFQYIESTAVSHEPLFITCKDTSSVLMSMEDYSALKETLYLLSDPDMARKLKEGMDEGLENAVSYEELKASGAFENE